jgi:hypothetical protein
MTRCCPAKETHIHTHKGLSGGEEEGKAMAFTYSSVFFSQKMQHDDARRKMKKG